MSYNFDDIVIDWDEGTYTIIIGGDEYTYGIDEESELLENALEYGVNYTEVGGEGHEKAFNVELYDPEDWGKEDEDDGFGSGW